MNNQQTPIPILATLQRLELAPFTSVEVYTYGQTLRVLDGLVLVTTNQEDIVLENGDQISLPMHGFSIIRSSGNQFARVDVLTFQ